MKLPVLTAADGAAWEADLVTALDRGDHGVTVVRRCVDIVDLLAVAAAGQGRAALVAAGLRRLDADAVDRLIAAQVVPVGVVRRGDTAAEDRLRAAGIGHLVPDDADPSVVASVITDAVRTAAAGARTPRMFGDPATSMAIPPGAGAPVSADLPARRGSVVAVWGPTGAPGRTLVAATLADEIARLGTNTLLVDADVYGGSVAVLLGLLDESPGLAAACRQAGATRLEAAALAALCWQLAPTLRVLTGIPIAQRWPEVRATAIEPVLGAARNLAAFTVVDCGFGLETDEELSFDSLAPRRNGATLAVLDQADVILAVGAADPIGLHRLVRGLAELRDAEVSAPIWVVLNKVRRGVVAGDPASELTAALERFAGRTPAALLPLDQEAVDAALAAGRLLGESRPSSPLRQAVAELAAALVGVPAQPSRRRRR
ncbi:MAG: ATPase involved in chromosome partitioning [Pseudonocardiales bacterium]|nr:ATPase involved in chromosome partitioning [Pseudonocardiales bacterium]